MRLTVASFKGGSSKTTTAVHLAAFLQTKADTVLLDGDQNSSASDWADAGHLPFRVTDDPAAVGGMDCRHLVVDTQARPSTDELRDLAAACDLLVIPTTPDAMSLRVMKATIQALRDLRVSRYKVLLTIIPPLPNRDGEEARAYLLESKVPVFKAGIRRLSAFQKAALAGVLVHQVPNDRRAIHGWEDYQAVGRELFR